MFETLVLGREGGREQMECVCVDARMFETLVLGRDGGGWGREQMGGGGV